MDTVQPASDEITYEIKHGGQDEQTTTLGSQEAKTTSEEIPDHVRYEKLFKAFQEKDWKGVEDFINKNPQALRAKIDMCWEETIFHIIARQLDFPFWLIEKLASMVAPELLEQLKDGFGKSPIFQAAYSGNTKAAAAFVRRNKDLPNIQDNEGLLPIHCAASYGHKEIIQYLLSVTKIHLDDKRGVAMLQYLIEFDLFDIALDLLRRYPQLACEVKDRGIILSKLSSKPRVFESGSRFGFWKRLIYKSIPLQHHVPQPENVVGDVENLITIRSKKMNKYTYFGYIPRKIYNALGAVPQKLSIMFWNALMQLVPGIKSIHDTKLTNTETLQIVRIMCHEGIIWSNKEALEYFPFLQAAQWGIFEIVNEISKAYYYSFTFQNNYTGYSLLHIAILHRQEKVFSLIDKMESFVWQWKEPRRTENIDEGNILHLAARLVTSSQVSGAALQMQRELQWFKAVENFVHPTLQEQRNRDKKTPRELFTEEHKGLVKEGEKWMKGTASSCSVVAALIITVVFAAAFTTPGGNDSTEGLPVFLHKQSFIVFVVSDALALFSSTASVLMFLGILTSRYSEEDFLESLPKKLIIGLVTLFFSIANMMIAFGATIFIFLSHRWNWTIIPIFLLGCLPVTLFVLLQFPLLVEIYSHTYQSSLIQTRKKGGNESSEEIKKLIDAQQIKLF